MASVHLPGDEVFGIALSPVVTVDEVGRMPFAFVLAFVAATLADHGKVPDRVTRATGSS